MDSFNSIPNSIPHSVNVNEEEASTSSNNIVTTESYINRGSKIFTYFPNYIWNSSANMGGVNKNGNPVPESNGGSIPKFNGGPIPKFNEGSISASNGNPIPESNKDSERASPVCLNVQDNYNNLVVEMKRLSLDKDVRICHECGKISKCNFNINYNKNEIWYFCSFKCMNTFPPSSLTELQVLSLYSTPKIKFIESTYIRKCVACRKDIVIPECDKLLWEGKEVCNKACLLNYQLKILGMNCASCNCFIEKISPLFGRISCRFGDEVKQFCSSLCLEKFNRENNLCTFCNQVIYEFEVLRHIIPPFHSSDYKEFCSAICLRNYCGRSLNISRSQLLEGPQSCFMCKIEADVIIVYQQDELCTYNFCSILCFSKFQYFRKIVPLKCHICNKLYDKDDFLKNTLYHNGPKNFCEVGCQNAYFVIQRFVVSCENCAIEKYNFEMIKKKFANKYFLYFCSVYCLNKVVVNATTSHTTTNYLNSNFANYITSLINSPANLIHNTMSQPSPLTADATTQYDDIENVEKETQTTCNSLQANYIFVPIPVPIPIPFFNPNICIDSNIIKNLDYDNLIQPKIITITTAAYKSFKFIKKKGKKVYVKNETPILTIPFKDEFGINALEYWIHNKNVVLSKFSNTVPIKHIWDMTKYDINYYLILFVKDLQNEIKLAPDTIFYLCLGIQKKLLTNNKPYYIFFEDSFKRFTLIFNELALNFISKIDTSIHIVTRIEEEYLWESYQFGTKTPYVLLNTLIYFNMKYFKLKTVQAHLQLLCHQITIVETETESYLKYFPIVEGKSSKFHCEIKQFEDKTRCPVTIMKFYFSKYPEGFKSTLFYLNPEMEYDDSTWFTGQALDEDDLAKMINRLRMVKEINEMFLRM